MRIGTPFCQAIYKGIEGKEWEAWYYHYRELYQATFTKKPGDSQKAKALWTVKAARDRDDGFYDPARKNDIQGRTRTRVVLREEHRKSLVAVLAKALDCLDAVCDC